MNIKKISLFCKLICCMVISTYMEFSYADSSDNATSPSSTETQSPIVLLVSLGMPDLTLQVYLKQAEIYHIPVVIRGLYTDKESKNADRVLGSFQDTSKRIFNLLKGQNKQAQKIIGGVSINPLIFRQYGVHVVPALVISLEGAHCQKRSKPSPKEPECQDADFDIVYGNVPIEKQLRLIAEKSPNQWRALLAKKTLNQYSADASHTVNPKKGGV